MTEGGRRGPCDDDKGKTITKLSASTSIDKDLLLVGSSAEPFGDESTAPAPPKRVLGR